MVLGAGTTSGKGLVFLLGLEGVCREGYPQYVGWVSVPPSVTPLITLSE